MLGKMAQKTTITDFEPVVTLEEMKRHLHIATEDFDQQLLLDVQAAIASAEAFTGLQIRKKIDVYSVPFAETITLPEGDYTIDSVKVDDEEVDYIIVDNKLSVGVAKGDNVVYSVVYGYDCCDCPADIKMAIMLSAAKFFNSPVDSVEQLPKASTALLRTHKKYNI